MPQPRKTNAQRGLGWSHQKRRAYLLSVHVNGTPCDVCGLPMYLEQPLDADHTIPRSQGGTLADRLLHAWCNRGRGDGKRERPAGTFIPVRTSRDW
jgi:hypothetical protein